MLSHRPTQVDNERNFAPVEIVAASSARVTSNLRTPPSAKLRTPWQIGNDRLKIELVEIIAAPSAIDPAS
jgi:hypothetical protein